MKRAFLAVLIVAAAFAVAPSAAVAGPVSPFTQCPGVGLDPTGCQFLVVFNADSTISTFQSTTDLGPYDGIEDTLVGIQNNTGHSIASITLGPAVGVNGLGPFGLDGDGACAQIACGNVTDGSGYGGLVHDSLGANVGDVFYSNIQSINVFADKGTVNFGANGIPAGGSAWFSLEDSFTLNTFPTSGVPEPGSLFLLGTGILAVARRFRKA